MKKGITPAEFIVIIALLIAIAGVVVPLASKELRARSRVKAAEREGLEFSQANVTIHGTESAGWIRNGNNFRICLVETHSVDDEQYEISRVFFEPGEEQKKFIYSGNVFSVYTQTGELLGKIEPRLPPYIPRP